MRSRNPWSGASLRRYGVCPDCDAKYTVDAKTRRRRIPITLLALVASFSTFAAALVGLAWVVPAIAGHVALWTYLAYAISKMRYVRYCG